MMEEVKEKSQYIRRRQLYDEIGKAMGRQGWGGA